MPRKPRLIQSEFPIHITARAHSRQAFPIALESVWEIMSRHLYFINRAWGVQIIAFVLMPNHFHLIVRDPELNLSKAIGHLMHETSREMGQRSGITNQKWGGRFHSSVITSPLYFLHAYKYVYRNPVTAHLCERVEHYRFSTLRGLLGADWSLIPLTYDDTLWDGGVERTLTWLNQEYSAQSHDSIKAALRKAEFSVRLDPSCRAPGALNDWNSVPFSPENYEKEPGTLSFLAGSEAPPPARFG